MRIALVLALLVLGAVDAGWILDNLAVDGTTTSADVSKMDGTEQPPPKP